MSGTEIERVNINIIILKEPLSYLCLIRIYAALLEDLQIAMYVNFFVHSQILSSLLDCLVCDNYNTINSDIITCENIRRFK